MPWRAVVRSSDHVLRGRSRRHSLYYYCFRYRHSRVMRVGRAAGTGSGLLLPVLVPVPAASAVLGPFLKSAQAASSPDGDSLERQEQAASGRRAGGLLFLRARVPGASVNIMASCARSAVRSRGKPAGRLLRPHGAEARARRRPFQRVDSRWDKWRP